MIKYIQLISENKITEHFYTQMIKEIEDLITKLTFQNIAAGNKILLDIPNSIETVIAYLAIWQIGATTILIPEKTTPKEKEYYYKACPWQFVLLPEKQIHTAANLEDVKNTNNTIQTSMDNIATVHFTSGSTGQPKPIAHTFQHILNCSHNSKTELDYKDSDHLLISLPLIHAFAFSYQLLPALARGLTFEIIESFDPEIMIQLLFQNKITSIALLPHQCYKLTQTWLSTQSKGKTALTSCLTAGDRLSIKTSREFYEIFNFHPAEGLGSTETFGITINSLRQPKLGSIGKALKMTNIRIKNETLWIQSPTLGYNLNLSTQPKDDWYNTGDFVKQDEEGYLYFLGRANDRLVHQGTNVWPSIIENAISEIPHILDVKVIGIADDIDGHHIIAYVVHRSGERMTEALIEEYLQKTLNPKKHPDQIIFLTKLPRTRTGKINIKELKSF